MSCYCCIVPPQLLEGIANSTENSDNVRAKARAALEAHKDMATARHEHTTALHHGYTSQHHHPGGIIPQDLLRHVAESDAVDETTRARAKRDLESLTDSSSHDQHATATSKDSPYRFVYDAHHRKDTRGTLVRTEGQLPVNDDAVNEVYDNAGIVLKFYKDLFNWNSIDNKNMDIIQTVHYGEDFQNAFWDGQQFHQMFYGDGGEFIYNFTGTLDVIAHELSHGVTQYSSPLVYQSQSGALNEHLSDVFGIMCKHRKENVKSADDDWLIGEGVLLPGVRGVALRSMKAPGTAYNDPRFGSDDQPDNMKNYIELQVNRQTDFGGVHKYSGIPNKAFFNAAMAFGGFSWDIAGQIWWKARVSGRIPPLCTFQQFADITVDCALEFGRDAAKAVRQAWVDVGVERDVEEEVQLSRDSIIHLHEACGMNSIRRMCRSPNFRSSTRCNTLVCFNANHAWRGQDPV